MVFTVIRSGFVARCALETDNAADNRFEKICRIIGECRYAGQDIHSHQGDVNRLIVELATWLRAQSGDVHIPGGVAIGAEFAAFNLTLPAIYAARQLDPAEVTFGDFSAVVVQYLTT